MTTVSDEILEKIKQGGIEPMPVWRFILKNGIFWFVWAVALTIGAVSFSAMLFVFANAGWELHEATHESSFEYLLELLPYFWILALSVMIGIGLYNIRHTKNGYRYSFLLLIVFNVILSLLIGSLLFLIGFGKLADEGVGRRTSLHESIMEMQESHWVNPGLGLLAGEITAVDNENMTLALTAFDDSDWVINISDLFETDCGDLVIGDEIRVIGVLTEESNEMYGCLIMGWSNPPEFEIFFNEERSTNCIGVRPLQALRRLRSN